MISIVFQPFQRFTMLVYFQQFANKELNGFNLGHGQWRRGIGERVGKADITTKSSVAKS